MKDGHAPIQTETSRSTNFKASSLIELLNPTFAAYLGSDFVDLENTTLSWWKIRFFFFKSSWNTSTEKENNTTQLTNIWVGNFEDADL